VSDPIKRDEKGGRDSTSGRFVPGYKGGGRRAIDPEVREMLTAATPDAARRLIDALDATDGDEPDHDMRVKAANAILDRVYGKPTQAIAGEDGEPLRIDIGVVDILKKLAEP
jgi:hypothetical protein